MTNLQFLLHFGSVWFVSEAPQIQDDLGGRTAELGQRSAKKRQLFGVD